MLPFFPFIAQGHNGASNAPLSQQVNGNSNNGTPNFMPLQGQQSQVGFNPNPQNPAAFNNPNPIMGNGNQRPMQNDHLGKPLLGNLGSAPPMPQQTHGGIGQQNLNALGGLGNLVAQNLLSGLLANGSINALNPNAGLVNAQLALQNQLQSVNQLLSMALLNPSQLGSFNPMAACGNQLAQGVIPQNGAFPGNPQLGLLQPNGVGQQVNLGQQNSFPPMVNGNIPNQFSAPNQQMQMNSFMPSSSGRSQPHNNQAMSSQPQGTQGNRDRMNSSTPNHRHNRTFIKDHNAGASSWSDRSQNAQNQYPQKMNVKQKFSNDSREKGNIGGGGTDIMQNSRNDSKGGKRRLPVIQYSDKEVQQWRDERRKFYPTKANVQKKQLPDGKSSGDAEQEAELRRQQLKNILAKQAELGFETPEIPPHYLSDAEGKQQLGSDQRKRPFKQNDRFQNRFNNKRGRFDRNEPFKPKRPPFPSKQQQQDEHGKWKNHQSSTRKPTLLEKLLTSDLKRDRSHLLQAFRFMVMNSFFEDDSKQLTFPTVIVKETSSELANPIKIEELVACEDAPDDEVVKLEAEEGEVTD